MQNALHAARLALLEAALMSLLHEHAGSFDSPDSITASFGPEGLDIEYKLSGLTMSGEGL